jgi:hypothetical protein
MRREASGLRRLTAGLARETNIVQLESNMVCETDNPKKIHRGRGTGVSPVRFLICCVAWIETHGRDARATENFA